MNNIFDYSVYIIPLVVMIIIIVGLKNKVKVYDQFIDGAKDGMIIVAQICPTLVGLFVAVGIFDASKALDLVTRILKPVAGIIHTPPCVIPVVITKMFSSGSATSLMLNIFQKYGPDSIEGTTAAIILCSTESIFYTMSVYLMAAGVSKSRYILPAAIISTLSGVVASIIIAGIIF